MGFRIGFSNKAKTVELCCEEKAVKLEEVAVAAAAVHNDIDGNGKISLVLLRAL